MKRLIALSCALVVAIAAYAKSLSDPVFVASLGGDITGCVFYAPMESATVSIGNNLTVNGSVTFTAGKHGNAATFDGNDSYLTALTDANFAAAINAQTVEFWVRYDWPPVNRYFFVANEDGTWLPGILTDYGTPTLVALIAYNDSVQYSTYGYPLPASPTNGTWHHLAFTFNSFGLNGNRQQKVYLDGVLAADIPGDDVYLNASSSPIRADFSTFVIGKEKLDGNEYFTGQIDELAVYNRELTAGEIQAIYQSGGNIKRRL